MGMAFIKEILNEIFFDVTYKAFWVTCWLVVK